MCGSARFVADRLITIYECACVYEIDMFIELRNMVLTLLLWAHSTFYSNTDIFFVVVVPEYVQLDFFTGNV